MALPPAVQSVYGRYWSLAQDFASARDETGAYVVQSSDFISAASQLAREAGQALSFAEASGLPGLFSSARKISNATAALNSAGLTAAIDASMIAPWPTAASPQTQAAQPRYDVRFQFTYTDQLGMKRTVWNTLAGVTQLPGSVGNLGLRLQGAAIAAYTTPVQEGGKYPLPGEMMAEFGSILSMQILAV